MCPHRKYNTATPPTNGFLSVNVKCPLCLPEGHTERVEEYVAHDGFIPIFLSYQEREILPSLLYQESTSILVPNLMKAIVESGFSQPAHQIPRATPG